MTEKSTKKEKMNTVDLKPKTYFEVMYKMKGHYNDEDRFDKSIGLSWLGDYTFKITDKNLWLESKAKYKF